MKKFQIKLNYTNKYRNIKWIKMTDENSFSYFCGYMGIASALVLANLGAAYWTAKSGFGICSMGVLKPDKIIKSVIQVIMAVIIKELEMIILIKMDILIWLRVFAVDCPHLKRELL